MLTDSTVNGNSTDTNSYFGSAPGGGIRTSFSGDVALTNSTVSGNSAKGAGGGIYTDNGGVTLTTSTVSGNSTTGRYGDGGGISTDNGRVTLTSSTISGNISSDDGGGIKTSYGRVTLTTSTVSGNSASGSGGGVYTYRGGVTLTSSTVSSNSGGGTGGVVSVDSSFPDFDTIENSIISGNTGNGGPSDLSLYPYSLTINHSIITSTRFYTGTGNQFFVDPLLGPLADNGGPTLTHSLLSGSPAIDMGDPEITGFDQRGTPFSRDDGNGVDIGAFEVQSIEFDFGDAPDSYATTTPGGPSHQATGRDLGIPEIENWAASQVTTPTATAAMMTACCSVRSCPGAMAGINIDLQNASRAPWSMPGSISMAMVYGTMQRKKSSAGEPVTDGTTNQKLFRSCGK